MKREEVIRMAREADLIDDTWARDWYVFQLERFAQLVAEKATEEANARANASWTLMCKKMVAAEREACAKVCDEYAYVKPMSEFMHGSAAGANSCAIAIRTRSSATSRGQQ